MRVQSRVLKRIHSIDLSAELQRVVMGSKGWLKVMIFIIFFIGTAIFAVLIAT